MAIELFSDNSSMGMSPRISFSHDFSHSDGVPIEQYIRSTSSSSSIDFDFCVFRESFDESSSADELFSEGKILPIEIKRKLGSTTSTTKKSLSSEPPTPPQLRTPESSLRGRDFAKNEQNRNEKRGGGSSESNEKPSNRSFWRFKRSYSLNCGSGYARSLCPLPLLSRSNSTGSTPNVKRSSSGKDHSFSSNKQHLSKSASTGNHLKPPLKKSYGSYSNGVKVTPVLNVPSPIMFGLGSIFSPGKDRIKKK